MAVSHGIEEVAVIVVYFGYGFAQLRSAGVDLSSLITTSAILTAVIAFAMQDALADAPAAPLPGNFIGRLRRFFGASA